MGQSLALLALLVFLQLPAIGTTVNQDRQNYREAVRYVEGEMSDGTGGARFFYRVCR